MAFREDILAAEDIELGFRLYVRGMGVKLLLGVVIVHNDANGQSGSIAPGRGDSCVIYSLLR